MLRSSLLKLNSFSYPFASHSRKATGLPIRSEEFQLEDDEKKFPSHYTPFLPYVKWSIDG